jgi:hypothetical protein
VVTYLTFLDILWKVFRFFGLWQCWNGSSECLGNYYPFLQ